MTTSFNFYFTSHLTNLAGIRKLYSCFVIWMILSNQTVGAQVVWNINLRFEKDKLPQVL